MPRTNIAVDKQLALRLADESEKENKTAYAMANEMLNSCLDLISKGGNVSSMPKFWEIIKIMKDVDAVPVPGNLLEEVINRLYTYDREWLMKIGRKQGEELGLYLSTFYPSIFDLIANSKDVLTQIFPIKRFDLESMKKSGEATIFVFKTAGVGRSKETAEFVNEVLRGLFSVYREVLICNCQVNTGVLEIGFEISDAEMEKLIKRSA
ncbi:MAG: hypothetical protein JRN10_03680 [Nitrososphaerota archaeon]|nr:hypothetical protein [Nitrososphaerota archaeon]MDG6930328.1 hypothetical protein [Nitrososphaerota archaeon]